MPQRTLRVLLVDQNESSYDEVKRELYRLSDDDRHDFGIEWRQSLAAACQTVEHNHFDVILLDFDLPDAVGDEAFLRLSRRVPDLPILIFSALDSLSLALKLMEAGAQDYLVKGKFQGSLAQAIVFAVKRQTNINELAARERSTRASSMLKSSYFSNLSHELRNPLTAIIGYSEALSSSELTEAERIPALSAIHANGKHLLKLIGDILDIAKIDAGELKIEMSEEPLVPFLRELRQAVEQSAKNKNLELTFRLDAPFPQRLTTDFFRLRQILYNLLGNALKFTKEGYVRLEVSVNQDDETVIFTVKDSGVGISEKGKQELFKAFSQATGAGQAREFGGTGLGLVISRELVRRLGGTIEFRSRVGVGSVFSATLPLGEAGNASLSSEVPDLAEQVLPLEHMAATKMQGKVLVVDDIEDNRNLLHLLLSKIGLTVSRAENGAEALQRIEAESFDLILLDMQMPVMDGYATVRTLRSRGCVAPVVAMTALVLEESQEECLADGCDACLSKPFTQQDLFFCVHRFLGRQGTEGPIDSEERPSVKRDELAVVRRNFVKRLPDRLAELEAALEEKDLDKLRAEAHKLIGAGLFGFKELSQFGGVLESIVIQEQVGGFGLVEALVNKVRHEIENAEAAQSSKGGSSGAGDGKVTAVTPQILVFDGEEVNRKALCRVLKLKGFTPLNAGSKEDALELCNDGGVALIVYAVEGDAADDLDTIAAMRARLNRNVPVIIMTTELPSEILPIVAPFGVSHVLTKPVLRDQVLGAIDSILADNLDKRPD